jgi:nucleoside-diphosphate-sugar epimerase
MNPPISCVTGGTGFVGTHLVRRLISEGHEVRVLARNPEKARSLFGDQVKVVAGDLGNEDALTECVGGADFVFHLAAHIGYFGRKELFYQTNVEGSKRLLDIAEAHNIKRFVFMSTNAVIGYKREKVTDESTPYSYRSGLSGITKIITEKDILERYKKNGFPGVILRPSIIYGPGCYFYILRPLELIKAGKMSLIGGGKGICWHIYIDNLVDAVLQVAEDERAVGEIFTLSDNKIDTTWKEYFNALAEAAGFPPIKKNMPKWLALCLSYMMYALHKTLGIKPLMTPMAVGIMTSESGLSIEKAKKVLNYSPRIDLEEGMKRVGRWLKEAGHLD